jgi:cyclic pyranopterin phosphate synthase
MTIVDRHQRPLRSLRLSVTDRCNLRCEYCMPEKEYVWLPREDILTFEEIDRLLEVFTALGVEQVRLTGGEPLLRRDLDRLVGRIAARPEIRDLALTTNGVLLAEQAVALKAAGLHRLTVSLDTLRRDRFQRLARYDALDDVLAGVEAARDAGFRHLKIDSVIMRGVNDDELVSLLNYARRVEAEIRFIEYMDVGGATRWTPGAVVPRREILATLRDCYGAVDPLLETSSAPADRYRLPDGTVFGVISSTTQPFCDACDRSRLTADGIWLLCLYALEGLDLRTPLRQGASTDDLQALLARTWERRTDRGALDRAQANHRLPIIPVASLKKNAHLEMHTRGG